VNGDRIAKEIWGELEPVEQLLFTNKQLQAVIPVEAGIHVLQAFQWTPAFAGVTIIGTIFGFETGSNHKEGAGRNTCPFLWPVPLELLYVVLSPPLKGGCWT